MLNGNVLKEKKRKKKEEEELQDFMIEQLFS